MAAIVFNRGLQVIGGRASSTADSFAALQSISVDDSSNAFAAGDTALNTGGAVSNQADVDFDSTPTRSAQTVTHLGTFGTGVANFTIRRIVIHNAAAASVTTSSTTVVAGIDGQTLAKTSDFSITFELSIAYADNS